MTGRSPKHASTTLAGVPGVPGSPPGWHQGVRNPRTARPYSKPAALPAPNAMPCNGHRNGYPDGICT